MGATLTTGGRAAGEADAVVRQAFDAPRLTIGELAVRLGIPRGTLATYITGKRRTPAPIARRLAAVLRQHAEELAAIAGTLEEAALETEDGEDGAVSVAR